MLFHVISDTHGLCRDALKKLLPVFNEGEYLFHLGDGVRDLSAIADRAKCKIVCVRGNNDPAASAPPFRTIDMGDNRLLLVHGHEHGTDPLSLYLLAAEHNCTHVFYGHTHVSDVTIYKGVVLVNPGSLALPRAKKPSYARVETENGQLSVKIVFI